ncbi:MAG: undecaprenyl-diphosphate phosphatase [Clostridia bacterium]|nr:undecaprenyl-diphosphate phosphatase [Clostridia bacterium]
MLIELLKTLLIGIVQGITEWLPVSSTGHMILLDELIKLNVSDAFMELFRVVIQLGSILAVLVLYFHKLNPFAPSKTQIEKKDTWTLWFKVVVAVIPSAVIGLLLDDWFDAHFYNYITVAITLVAYGVIFLFLDRLGSQKKLVERTQDISWRTAFLVGCFQVLSIIPGTSRSGSTIIGALLMGLSRPVAAEFSFFMAIPTMLGASGLKAVKFLLDGAAMTGAEGVILLFGCAVAFIVSLLSIRALMNYVRNHSFKAFGVYRIVLGVIVLMWYLLH